jgi:hypothetical protein
MYSLCMDVKYSSLSPLLSSGQKKRGTEELLLLFSTIHMVSLHGLHAKASMVLYDLGPKWNKPRIISKASQTLQKISAIYLKALLK